jgi:hypothetical protein
MNPLLPRWIPLALVVAAASIDAWHAQAGREFVKFPESYATGVHYATVTRDNIRA